MQDFYIFAKNFHINKAIIRRHGYIYHSLIAFFMTGTGNSYTVARWCARVAETTGIGSKLVQIKAGEKRGSVPPQSLAVFTYPTHGFTAPWLIMKYIWCLPNGRNLHAIVLPTRAGIRIKGAFFPGLEGTAGYLIAFLLWLRGYRVQGVMGVDMPSNWTALHWGLSKQNAAVIIEMAQSKVKGMLIWLYTGSHCASLWLVARCIREPDNSGGCGKTVAYSLFPALPGFERISQGHSSTLVRLCAKIFTNCKGIIEAGR